jgi:lipoyl(octanoyl) transferase
VSNSEKRAVDPHAPAAGAPLDLVWLGRVPYRPTWQLQERLRAAVLDGTGQESILLLEHFPVITLGRSADARHVLLDGVALARAGIERVETSRGGDVTYHGPGQLVAYPVVRLPGGPASYVTALAQAVIEVVARLGVSACYRRDCPGVWVEGRKLCALGIHVHRRVAIHGLALNVTTALEAFDAIVPCGLAGVPVTSLVQLLGREPPGVRALAESLGEAIAAQLGRPGRWRTADDLWASFPSVAPM